MYSYVSKDIPALLASQFPQFTRRYGISGLGMGGHGALTIGLRNPQQFFSISAFAPICHPKQSSWGVDAFSYYLSTDRENWDQYDAVTLVQAQVSKTPILLDQGLQDPYLAKQLNIRELEIACTNKHHPLEAHFREGYDHSFYFVASFLEKHIQYHSQQLSPVSLANSA